MKRSGAGRWGAAAILSAAVLGGGPAPARARDAAAEARLAERGIVRNGSGFVLRAEAEVRPKVDAVRSRDAALAAAGDELRGIDRALEAIPALNQQVIDLRGQIVAIEFQMKQFPATFRAGRWIHGSNMQEDAVFQGFKSNRDALQAEVGRAIQRRDTLQNMAPGRKRGPAQERYRGAWSDAREALAQLRRAVDETLKLYGELAKSAEVVRALEALGRPRFGPSAEFAAVVRELERFEKSVGQKPESPERLATGKAAGPARQVGAINPAQSKLRIARQTEKNGHIKGARTFYKEIVDLFPGTPEAGEAADRLRALPAD